MVKQEDDFKKVIFACKGVMRLRFPVQRNLPTESKCVYRIAPKWGPTFKKEHREYWWKAMGRHNDNICGTSDLLY